MADAHEQMLCAMCNEPGTYICNCCKSIKYCSKTCQKLDWPIHKLICKTYKNFLASCPGQDHSSMLYFAVGEARPRFIWVRIDKGHNHPSLEELARHQINIDHSDSQYHLSQKSLKGNTVLNRPLGQHYITFIPPSAAQCCPCCKSKYKANDSLVGVDAELADTLRGSILAWAMHLEDHIAQKSNPVDLGPMDFRHMVDELRLHYSEATDAYHDFASLKAGPKCIQGVRLNCKGDQQLLQKPHIEPITAPGSVLIEQSVLSTPIADRLGMPLHVSKLAPAPIWRDRRLKERMHNCCSGYLGPFVSVQDDIGSLVIVRKDGKELPPALLQALFNLTTRKLEANGTKLPFLMNRLESFTEQDITLWEMTLAALGKA